MSFEEKAIHALLSTNAHRATQYVTERYVVTATRRLFRGKLPRKGSNIDIILKIGRPNYRERLFIKAAKKAGEKFPIKKIQLQFPQKKKTK